MRTGRTFRRSFGLLLPLLLLAACGGGGEPTTTTLDPFTEAEESFLVALSPAMAATDLEAVDVVRIGHDACHSLRLLGAAGLTGPAAADAIRLIDLTGLTTAELVLVGSAFAQAPVILCPDVALLGADVAYWLGI